MTFEQLIAFAVLLAALVLFIWGRFRHDLVALIALLAAVLAGLVPAADAFRGFGHPAVITVAAVLVLGRALINSGAVDLITSRLPLAADNAYVHIGLLAVLAAALSTVMNNVAALALLMPVALESAGKAKRPPAMILMPVSFGSILGGLVTLIGTPPNIIIANFRAENTGTPFGMFDFSPVGGAIAVVGVVFVVLAGWRFIPAKRRKRVSPEALFDIEDYVTEAKVPDESPAVGKSVREVDDMIEDVDAVIVGLVRGDRRILGPARRERVQAGDSVIIEAAPKEIDKFVKRLGLSLVGATDDGLKMLRSDDVAVVEAVVTARSRIEGRTPSQLRLRRRHGVNLLAVSRQGQPFRGRLKSFRFRGGDVLLLQGDAEALPDIIASLGCLPLAERKLKLGQPGRAGLAAGVFAIAVIAASAGIIAVPVALATAALITVVLNIVPARELYDAVDWPVIVLLGAMIPVAGALQSTGATQLVAGGLLTLASGVTPMLILALVLVMTMTLSDLMNNAATAIVMAPVAVALANAMGVNADAFLMAVAVGASCAFLTPIGHQNNTLIMGPGGYEFGDYWRMGLPLEILIVLIGVPMILWVWPL